jgi:hypothetical protein
MERLSYRAISLDDLEPYAEFLADPQCTRYLLVPEPHSVAKTLGAEHERDTEILGGPVSIYASDRSK